MNGGERKTKEEGKRDLSFCFRFLLFLLLPLLSSFPSHLFPSRWLPRLLSYTEMASPGSSSSQPTGRGLFSQYISQSSLSGPLLIFLSFCTPAQSLEIKFLKLLISRVPVGFYKRESCGRNEPFFPGISWGTVRGCQQMWGFVSGFRFSSWQSSLQYCRHLTPSLAASGASSDELTFRAAGRWNCWHQRSSDSWLFWLPDWQLTVKKQLFWPSIHSPPNVYGNLQFPEFNLIKIPRAASILTKTWLSPFNFCHSMETQLLTERARKISW